MSPVGVRRWRAERLLRRDFEALRARVLSAVRRRLRASGAALAQVDLDACYAQAWQGLYAAVLAGQEIANPAGWLVVVTHRRAIDELRANARANRAGVGQRAQERDLAAELDERVRLRQLLEGLRASLSAREREAAALCYLQGLPRAQAAAQMGLSERAFRKLMEGRGEGRPGVASKVGTLVRTIGEDRWCEQQGSLMRALAYGILDPQGERHSAALRHSSQCPACRAYVASLRGLAAALPPVLLARSAAAGLLARAFGHAHHGAGGAGAASPAAGAAGAGPALAGGGVAGAGAASAGGLGAGGGGWLLAGGSVGAKLAAGCVLALSIGAGCIAVGVGALRAPQTRHRDAARATRTAPRRSAVLAGAPSAGSSEPRQATGGAVSYVSGPALTQAAKANREFGLEQAGAPARAATRQLSLARRARTARASSLAAPGAFSKSGARASNPASGGEGGAPPASEAQAEREFSPG
jgi:RNA polymerase sigma factor (sigma-70 family)